MTNQFLINYIREQFGFIPDNIPDSWRTAAEKAYRAQTKAQTKETPNNG